MQYDLSLAHESLREDPDTFYKRYGIHSLTQFLTKIFPLEELHFPKSSIYHHASHDPNDKYPDPNLTFFQGFKDRTAVDHLGEMTSFLGQPRKSSVIIQEYIRDFHNQYREFRYAKDLIRHPKDDGILEVINYGLLPSLYKYTTSVFVPYYSWANIERTVWSNVKEACKTSDRGNFRIIQVPEVLPSVGSFNTYSETQIDHSMLRRYNTPEKLTMLDIWKWIGDDSRDSSTMSLLTLEELQKVNLMFVYRNKWMTINLKTLDGWRRAKGSMTTPGAVSPHELQKVLLRGFMQLQTLASGVPLTPVLDSEPETVTSQDEDLTEEDEEDEDATTNTVVDVSPVMTQAPAPSETPIPSEITEGDYSTFVDHLDEDLAALDDVERAIQSTAITPKDPETQASYQEVRQMVYQEVSTEDRLRQDLEAIAGYDVISASEYRSKLKLLGKLNQFENPYDASQSVQDYIDVKREDLTIDPEKTKIPDSETVFDKSMLQSTLQQFDSGYIKNVLPRHIVAAVTAIQRGGVIVEDYQIEEERSALGTYEFHTVKLQPIDGQPSTVRFRLPKVNIEGEFTSNSNKYRMRKQRTDIPIRKINATKVGLSSYYGKVFVERSQKKRDDPDYWLYNYLLNAAMRKTSDIVEKVAPANVFDNYFKAPKIYSGLAMYFKALYLKDMTLVFDHRERLELFDPSLVKNLENDDGQNTSPKYRIVGKTTDGSPVLVDYADDFYIYRLPQPISDDTEINSTAEFHNRLKDALGQSSDQLIRLGSIFDILKVNPQQAPISYSTVTVYGEKIPTGLILGYMIGMENLFTLLGITPEVKTPDEKFALKAYEWSIGFRDKIFIFSSKDRLATLVLGGLNQYRNTLRKYVFDSFNEKNVYLNILMEQGLGVRYLREVNLLDRLFVDPITKGILESMHEPTTFKGLVVRAVEMLLLDMAPDSQDMAFQRIRGYERVAGAIYKELAMSVREYSARNIRGKSKVELHPFAIWSMVTQDPSVKLVEDINPLQNLKEQEAVTFVGEGGRNKDALPKGTRAYHENDMGTISEATVDSGDVGINTYLSANPNLTTMEGLTERYDFDKTGGTGLLSSSALYSPGATHDDPKRVNFISIQHGHSVACEGYHQPILRTGYDEIIPHRVSKQFAVMANKSGKVISRNDHGIIVEYDDGERVGVNLGRTYGKAEGSTYPHDIISSLKEGDVVNPGDAIAYNSGFFEPDILNPKRILMKAQMSVRCVLLESTQTHEDSSTISPRLSQLMTTRITKVRKFVVEFKQGIKNRIPEGTSVGPNDVLFVMEDEVTEGLGIFGDSELAETLNRLSNKAPKAKIKGVVDRYEVFYNGALEDMSESLRELALASDKAMINRYTSIGEAPITGLVNEEYRSEGTPLLSDQAEIIVYITKGDPATVGDKGVVANQMKSVIGEVMDYSLTTATGEPIDLVFSQRSIDKRVVLSPIIIGTTTTLLKLIGKKAVEIYRGTP